MWKVVNTRANLLEECLNALEAEQYQIFTIMQLGQPDPASNVPRDLKSLPERTTFSVVAHKPGE